MNYQIDYWDYYANHTGPRTHYCVEYWCGSAHEEQCNESLRVFDWGDYFKI